MTRRVRDLLAERAAERFVGRDRELALLLHALEEEGPPVTYLHGIGGVGKSSLLDAFTRQARARGAAVVSLDCRAIEPTERGFLHELVTAIGGGVPALDHAAERLAQLGNRVVLTLDTYEVFRLMDTWLRQVFVPALDANARVVLAGREPPVAPWRSSPGWQGLCCVVALGPLADRDALELLARAGVGDEEARRINRFARGHPLALELAAGAVSERAGADLEEAAIQRVVEELIHLYLADVHDPLARQALDAASVVRRTTLSLLGAMLPGAAPQDAYERLRALPFVESDRDGLHVHDTVQQAIAAALRSADPAAHRAYRRAAWRQLRTEVRTAGKPELWRYTADLLYLIENPVVREAFFPTGAHLYAVEPARPEDADAIRAIVRRFEGPRAAELLELWWACAPQAFSVARDRDGGVAGFYCMFDPATVEPSCLRADPVVQAWRAHLQREPVPRQRVLFLRHWLSRDQGELPSPVQAACWLDIKRTYMELRPQLRRLYSTVRDLPTYAPVVGKLGFRPIPEVGVDLDGAVYHTAMLDFGPASVDGWLAGLVAAELGVDDNEILDVEARELMLDGRRVGLTKLEFAMLHYLVQREGKAVSRAALLADVWGYNYEGGSNVVDVVVRSLRKKLGERAALIETVSGVGYRFRRA